MVSLIKPSLWTLILGVFVMCANAQTLTWYVSPEGKDTWSGQQAAPNQEGTDGPFATPEAALTASRQHPEQPRQILLAAGRYYLDKPVVLDAKDSGLTLQGAGAGKTILYGGRQITGWRKDGDHFWAADVPQAKEGTWDFRALVVNDRLCPRARLPQTGRLTHETSFPVRWMSSAGGGWERKPTRQELTTMQYKAGDLGPWLSLRNAEVTVYHMWDESMIGLASHDPTTRTLTFANPSAHPPGAFGVKTYVVWNVREGMTQPGQWYLDRDAGRIVYWPLPDESMETALVVAPTVETLLDLQGKAASPVKDVTVRSLTLSTTTTPCTAGGFGASNYRGALQATSCQNLQVVEVEITNTAGHAIREYGTKGLLIQGCHLHDLGAGGLRSGGGNGTIEGNHIDHVGLIYPSAIALSGGGGQEKYLIRRNEIHDTPYSGMAIGGNGTVIEENLLYRCMQELQDGAAIYVSGAKGNVLRRNMVRDVVKMGEGYGISAYYLDEKCRDCVIEGNVSIGVARPTLTHMTLNCTVQNNVFLCDGDMELSFARSSGIRCLGNTLQLNGKLNVGDPDAVAEWSGNLVIQSGNVTPALSDAMPVPARAPREKPVYANLIALATPPTLDGKMEGDEWPAGGISLGDLPDQRKARGAPVTAKLCADASNLYVAVVVVSMFPEDRKTGTTWGTDEGVELAVQGTREDGTPVTYVLRGFTNSTFSSLPLGGASQAEADAFAKAVGYGAAVDKTVWRSEWRIPLSVLRVKPTDRATLPMNVTAYRSEDTQFLQWAGSLGDTWDLTRGGRAIFRSPQGAATPRAKAVAVASPLKKAPAPDGTVADADWPAAISLQETPDGSPLATRPCSARLATDSRNLLVRLDIPTPATAIAKGSEWRVSDGAEICLGGKTSDGKAVTWVLHGFADGTLEGSTEAGAPKAAVEALAAASTFRATVGEGGWRGQWSVPLTALGLAIGKSEVPFNLGVYRSNPGEWINWVGTQGPTWKLENAGLLRLEPAAGGQ